MKKQEQEECMEFLSTKFEHLECIGGSGEVYVGQSKEHWGVYAIKKINLLGREINPLKEINKLYSHHHPNLTQIFSHIHKINWMYVIMEWCDYSLASPEFSLPPPLLRVIELLFHICEGLKYLHNKGIPHLNLKPTNLLLKGGVLKISDFGILRDCNQGKGKRRPMSMSALKDPNLNSYPEFIAPELNIEGYQPKETDIQADIYSLGVLLHFLCTGNLNPTLPVLKAPLQSPEYSIFNEVIPKCLEGNPEQRPNIEGMLILLRSIQQRFQRSPGAAMQEPTQTANLRKELGNVKTELVKVSKKLKKMEIENERLCEKLLEVQNANELLSRKFELTCEQVAGLPRQVQTWMKYLPEKEQGKVSPRRGRSRSNKSDEKVPSSLHSQYKRKVSNTLSEGEYPASPLLLSEHSIGNINICTICTDRVSRSTSIVLECKHVFHLKCMRNYVSKQTQGKFLLTIKEQTQNPNLCPKCEIQIGRVIIMKLLSGDELQTIKSKYEEREAEQHEKALTSAKIVQEKYVTETSKGFNVREVPTRGTEDKVKREKKRKKTENTVKLMCRICFTEIERDETDRFKLINCLHVFHLSCLNKHFSRVQKTVSCPLCLELISTTDYCTICPNNILKNSK